METKTNPFYELRNRLYSSAAAGCSVIAEDFRLQRAIENFRPVSEKNKAFGKLFAMCEKLIKSENPSHDIVDCIALADALAVTQGIFMDSSETVPIPPTDLFNFRNIPYSKLREGITSIKMCNISNDYIFRYTDDPRIFNAYLESVNTESSSSSLISQVFEETYGEKLVPYLISTIDFVNGNGNQISYICRTGGAKFNDFYRETAENTSYGTNVRIKAIKAMSCSNENAEALLHLYRTESRNIKNTALISLAKLDSDIGNEEIEKYLSKFKIANTEVVKGSCRKICSDYAKKEAEYYCINKNYYVPSKKEEHHPLRDVIELLGNKTDVQDYIEKIANEISGLDYSVNAILIQNVFSHDDPKFRDMIINLYAKNPNAFFESRFTLALKENPEEIFDIFKENTIKSKKQTILTIMSRIFTLGGKKRIFYGYSSYYDKKQNVTLPFSEFPESLIRKFEEYGIKVHIQ